MERKEEEEKLEIAANTNTSKARNRTCINHDFTRKTSIHKTTSSSAHPNPKSRTREGGRKEEERGAAALALDCG